MPRLDTYIWRARVAPAIIAVAPILAFLSFVVQSPIVGLVAPAIGAGAAVLLAAEVTKSRGHAAEARLISKWDGLPTTRALSASGHKPHLRQQRRQAMEAVTGVALPTAADEAGDPGTARQMIQHCVRLAIAGLRTDATDSGVLASENASYGFRRNSRGIRGFAIATLAISMAVTAGVAVISGQLLVGACVLGLDLLLAVYWLLIVRDGWVLEQAEKFSDQLFIVAELAASKSLQSRSSTPSGVQESVAGSSISDHD
ncbi:hypothetical protein ITJ38_17510 [Agreia pratensis]|uniref:hypothetical protein n=1 Tax=Agreia pratensis TaxID=150121 RepID=UPI00188BBDF0|nr:hypothetical protein [Agreia pratensis]MBF4636211.1 hypothetical protein [Agreia pratensis]